MLLIPGLPIMILTGKRERERMEAAHTGTFMVPPVGVQKLFTWRRAIMGGVAAFAALAIIVIGYSTMRVMGIGSVGTLQAKGLLKAKQPILLAEFENRSSDSTLGPTLTEAFRVDLSQSQTVKLVDAQAVSDALKRMQKPAGLGAESGARARGRRARGRAGDRRGADRSGGEELRRFGARRLGEGRRGAHRGARDRGRPTPISSRHSTNSRARCASGSASRS